MKMKFSSRLLHHAEAATARLYAKSNTQKTYFTVEWLEFHNATRRQWCDSLLATKASRSRCSTIEDTMVFASRSLTCRTEHGDISVTIALGVPERGAYGWRCRYTIAWPEGGAESEVWGFDSMQALVLTLEKIGYDLYASDYHQTGRLRWTDSGQGYGFPVPMNARDLLVGDDLRFFG